MHVMEGNSVVLVIRNTFLVLSIIVFVFSTTFVQAADENKPETLEPLDASSSRMRICFLDLEN